MHSPRPPLLLTLPIVLAACRTTSSWRDPRGSTAEGAIVADTRAVFEAASAVVHEVSRTAGSCESRSEWIALGGSTDTVETRRDGSTDRFREKGELHVKLDHGFVHVDVRRDAPEPGTTVVRVRVHEAGGERGDAAFARRLLDRTLERVRGAAR